MTTPPLLQWFYAKEKELDLLIGRQLRLARENLDLKREDITTLMGIPPDQITDYETGEIGISVARLHLLWPCLDLKPAELFDSLPPMVSPPPGLGPDQS